MKIKQKLASQKGETISEVLVASLISVMALLLLATMIMSASRMVSKSDKKMSEFYNQVSALESGAANSSGGAVLDEGSDMVSITPAGSAPIEISVSVTKETNSGLTSYKK